MNIKNKTLIYVTYIGLISYSLWIFSFIYNPKLSYIQSYVSELDVTGQPYVWLVRMGNFVGATLLFTAFYTFFLKARLNKLSKEKAHLLKILSIATGAAILNAFFPMDCSASESKVCFQQQQRYSFGISQWIHLFTSIIMFGGLIYAQYFVAFNILKFAKVIFWFRVGQISFLLQLVLNILLVFVSITGHGPIGLLQRLSLLMLEIWLIVIIFNGKLKLLYE